MIFSSTKHLKDFPKVQTGYQVRAVSIDSRPLAKALQEADDKNAPLAIDWEADNSFNRLDPTDPSFDPKAIEEAHEIIDYCVKHNDGVARGIYGVLPPMSGEYNTIRIDKSHPQWRRQTGTLSHGNESIVDRVHILFPSLYLPYVWRQDWKKQKKQAIKVVKRAVGVGRDWQKEMRPYIRPYGFTKKEHWFEYVDIVQSEAQHCVIWENTDIPEDWFDFPDRLI